MAFWEREALLSHAGERRHFWNFKKHYDNEKEIEGACLHPTRPTSVLKPPLFSLCLQEIATDLLPNWFLGNLALGGAVLSPELQLPTPSPPPPPRDVCFTAQILHG